MKAALIHADRQTDKYEANWRFYYCKNAHKNLVWLPWTKTFKGRLQLCVNQWRQEAKYVLLPATRNP